MNTSAEQLNFFNHWLESNRHEQRRLYARTPGFTTDEGGTYTAQQSNEHETVRAKTAGHV